MADRMATEISIGGRIPRAIADDLADAVRNENVSLDWDAPVFSPTTIDDLLAVLVDGHLTLVDTARAWGEFDELETFLVAHHIAFTRHTEGKYEYSPEVVFFRRGMRRPVQFLTNQRGEISIPESNLAPIIKNLQRAYNRSTPFIARRLIETTLRRLHHMAGHTIPELPPFTIV